MKIAHVLWSFGTGGIESMLVDIANVQAQQNEVAIFIINNNYSSKQLDKFSPKIRIVRIGRTPGNKFPYSLLKFNILLRHYSPDIVHCHSDRIAKVCWGNYNLVRTVHNTHSSCSDYHKFKKILCISNAVKEYTESQGFVNCEIVYNGIHTDNIKVRTRPYQRGRQEECRIICVGRLHSMKGQDILVQALNEVVNNRGHRNVSLDLIGDGALRPSIEAAIVQYNLQNVVRLLGVKSRDLIYSRLRNYDLFIMPSISEGFGLTLAEACAAKIAVFTSDLAGPMEVIANGKFGRIFRAGDTNSLVDTIEDFLLQGYDEQMIENAYEYVRQNFDVMSTTQNYMRTYEEVIGK